MIPLFCSTLKHISQYRLLDIWEYDNDIAPMRAFHVVILLHFLPTDLANTILLTCLAPPITSDTQVLETNHYVRQQLTKRYV